MLVALGTPVNPVWNNVMQRRTAIKRRAVAINTHAVRLPVIQISLKAKNAAAN